MDSLTEREAKEACRRFRELGPAVNRRTRHNGRLAIIVDSAPLKEVRPMTGPDDFVDFPTSKRAVFGRNGVGRWVLLNPAA